MGFDDTTKQSHLYILRDTDIKLNLKRSSLLPRFKIHHHMLNRNLIPKDPQSHNNPRGLIAEVALMPPRLPRMHIAHMQLNKRDIHPQQRIPNRHGRMRETTRVDNDSVNVVTGCVDAVDQSTFVVGLEGVERCAHGGGVGGAGGLDIGESGVAVDVWFAGAEEVEVGAVEEED